MFRDTFDTVLPMPSEMVVHVESVLVRNISKPLRLITVPYSVHLAGEFC